MPSVAPGSLAFGRTLPAVSRPFTTIRPQEVVRVRTEVNLRESRPGPEGALPRVIRAVRQGPQVRIPEIDATRPVAPDEPDAAADRIFARVAVRPQLAAR